MARQKSNEARMTVYHLIGLRDLKDSIRDKYENFRCVEVKIGEHRSLLVTGTTEEKGVKWGELVAGLSGEAVDIKSSSPGALLLIPEETVGFSESLELDESRRRSGELEGGAGSDLFNAWAITFGIGFQMLDQRFIDLGFGKRIAIRCVDPAKLNSITKVTLDDRSKIDRSSIPSGATLRGFGFEEIGELATRIVASGKIEDIGTSDKSVIVRGADSLSIPLSKDPTKIIGNLICIKKLLEKEPVTEDLGLLEKISQIPNKNKEYIARLDKKLLDAIVDTARSNPIALAWPQETADELGEVQAFQLYGAQGRGRKALERQDGLPTLDSLLTPIWEAGESERQRRFEAMYVMLFENIDGDLKSGKIPVKNWLSFEVNFDGKKHFLHCGRWYTVEDDYSETVLRQTSEIFNRPSPLPPLSPWTKEHEDELAYNKYIAEECGGICLDRSLISVKSRKSRIEACDVLLKKGVFVHVKRVDSSAPASHLLAQALVSTEILTYDEEAREALKEKIKEAGHDPNEYECKPKDVVIVMVKNDHALTSESLYTFTQVNLNRHDKALADRGVGVYIVPIVRDAANASV